MGGDETENEGKKEERRWIESLADDEDDIEETVRRWARLNGTSIEDDEVGVPEGLAASLRVLEGPDRNAEFQITSFPAILGRFRKSTVCLRDAQISRIHAIIGFDGEHFTVIDNNTPNGTQLNGSRVKESKLAEGDKIGLGETVLEFRLARC